MHCVFLILSIIRLLSHQYRSVENLLFCDCFCIYEIQAVEIKVSIDVHILVRLIKNLPSDVVVDLLLHFLKLLKCNLLFVFLVPAILILFVYFLLQFFSNFFVFVDHTHSVLTNALIVISRVGLYGLQVLIIRKILVLFNQIWSPICRRFHQ
jgi:hypothetical protein